jgi:formylglycine-generating enzyme required for sulfatase activity
MKLKRSLHLLALLGAVGCAHPCVNDSSVPSAHAINAAKVSGILEPNIQAIIFYRDGDNIVIQGCDSTAEKNSQAECKAKPTTPVVRIKAADFGSHLKMILIGQGLGESARKKKKEIYKKGMQDIVTENERHRTEAMRILAQLEYLLEAHTQAVSNPDTVKDLREELNLIGDSLTSDLVSFSIVQNIARQNYFMMKLVDQFVGNPSLQKVVLAKNKQSFEFDVLRSYLRAPKLSARFSRIRKGSFQTGSPLSEQGRYDDEEQRSIRVDNDFEIQQTEITQAQWFSVMGYNPSRFKSKENCPEEYFEINGTTLCLTHPVDTVSWEDANKFIKRLNEGNDGHLYRLPTEAEWEYAARGGTQTAYSFGNDRKDLDAFAWYYGNSSMQSHPVASKKPNQFGLYDMHGNVWEWVEDWYTSYPPGPERHFRVFRGGSWFTDARDLRSAYRYGWWPYVINSRVGFRLVRTAK